MGGEGKMHLWGHRNPHRRYALGQPAVWGDVIMEGGHYGATFHLWGAPFFSYSHPYRDAHRITLKRSVHTGGG